MLRRTVLVALLLVAVGCNPTPQAPALRDSPVYQNKSAGFRFLVPQGWRQMATASLPDKLEQEFLVARYGLTTSPQGAMFEVMCFEPMGEFDAQKHHSGPSHGAKEWSPVKEEAKAGGPPVREDRQMFSASLAGKPTVKEVINVTKGNRVFSFIGLYGPSDSAAKEEIRRAVESLQWE
ncbi:MAG: hypothetical protein U1A77_23230 [Pirellulales bacterium]